MKGRLRIGLAALVAALAVVVVPQAMAGAPQDVQAVPAGREPGFMTVTDDAARAAFMSLRRSASRESVLCRLAWRSGSVMRVEVFPASGSSACVRELPDYADHHRRGNRLSVHSDLTRAAGVRASVDAVPADDRVHQRPHADRPEDRNRTGNGGRARAAPSTAARRARRRRLPERTFVLTATPAQGSVFTGWTGCTTVNAQNQCASRSTQSITVTANFAATFPLTVTKTGGGEGTVTSNPAGINCGTRGRARRTWRRAWRYS